MIPQLITYSPLFCSLAIFIYMRHVWYSCGYQDGFEDAVREFPYDDDEHDDNDCVIITKDGIIRNVKIEEIE